MFVCFMTLFWIGQTCRHFDIILTNSTIQNKCPNIICQNGGPPTHMQNNGLKLMARVGVALLLLFIYLFLTLSPKLVWVFEYSHTLKNYIIFGNEF